MTMYIPHIYGDERALAQMFGTVKPLWSIKPTEENLLEWMRDTYNIGVLVNQWRSETQICNLQLYQGIHWEGPLGLYGGDLRTIEGKISEDTTKELTINELYDYVQQKQSALSGFNISTTAVPHSNEHSDLEAAKVVKDIFETIKYTNHLKSIYNEMVAESVIYGYSYIMPVWDKHRGDLDPEWVEAKKKFGNKKGKASIGPDQLGYDPGRPVRIGDICYRRPLPWDVVKDFQQDPEDVEWIIVRSWEHVERVKFDYPSKKDKIRPSRDATRFNIDLLFAEELEDHVMVLEVYGRSNRFMDHGMYFKATPDVILEGPFDNPYPRLESSMWGNLPIEWLTDVDIPGRLYPMSTFQILGPLQHTINQIWTSMRENFLLGNHLNLLVPFQSKMKFGLTNRSRNMWYQAPFKPELLPMQSIPQDAFAFADLAGQKITQLQGLQGISKGNIDPNIRSGKQISLLQELEAQRGATSTQKKGDLVVAVDRKTLSVVGKFYRNSEERMLNILGKDKRPMIDSFNTSVLSKPFDVRLVQSDAFPESPSARIDAVNQLIQNPQFFELLTPEQWGNIVDLGAPEKFHDDTKVAVTKAEWENEQFVDGNNPPLPIAGDDHFNHWKVHMTVIRGQNFLTFSPRVQKEMIKHVRHHERMMAEHMEKQQNPIGIELEAQKLAQLSGWPAYYVLPEAPPPPPQQANGAAQMPEPIPEEELPQ